MNFDTAFTKPTAGGNISGTKEKSSAVIKLNSPITIFNIGVTTDYKNQEKDSCPRINPPIRKPI